MCGCSSAFDGEDQAKFEEGFDFVNDSNSDEVGFNEFNNFVDDAYTDFVDDGEEDNYDDFLTKKMRARRKRKVELKKSGVSSTEARKQALAEIPRDKLKTIISNISKGKGAVDSVSALSSTQKQAVQEAPPEEVEEAINNSGEGFEEGGNGITDEGGNDGKKAGFMGKNGMYIGIGALVLIGGYFAWKKFGSKKGA